MYKCLERKNYLDFPPLCERCLPTLERLGISRERIELDYQWKRVEEAFRDISETSYLTPTGTIVDRATYFGR